MSNDVKKPISRRHILKWSGASLAALAVGGAAWQFRPTVPAVFPEFALDVTQTTKPKLLIVYGSQLGSTAEQAVWMGEAARADGYAVQVAKAENAPRADDFDAIILGSAIRSNAWLDEAVEWAADNRDAFAHKPHALFQASMTVAHILQDLPDRQLKPEHLERLSTSLAGLHKAAPILKSADIAYLPGCLDYDRLTPVMRIVFPLASGSLSSGDFRDRQMVGNFATKNLAAFAA